MLVSPSVSLHAQSTPSAPAQAGARGQIAPGVAWENFVVADGPRNYNILRVEVADPHVTLETESGQDALFKGEKVLDTVRRESQAGGAPVLAGENADYWQTSSRVYTPVGLLVADGMIYTMPGKRSTFLFTADERSYIGHATMKVTIGAGTRQLQIDAINPAQKPKKDIALYTPPYGPELGPRPGKRYLLAMEKPEFLPNQPVKVKVTQISSETTTPLAAGTIILQVPPDSLRKAAGLVKDRSEATLLASIPQIKGVVRSACGGGPVLVRNGKPDIQAKKEGISESFVKLRHPRTAIGITKDQKNVFLVTIDGRQPKVSIGANLDELAEFMERLGCWQAMNLDGGGSTSMVVGDKVVNKPSDLQGPRTVANSLLVVATDPAAGPTPGQAAPTTQPGGAAR
jgi:hypothetical protein